MNVQQTKTYLGHSDPLLSYQQKRFTNLLKKEMYASNKKYIKQIPLIGFQHLKHTQHVCFLFHLRLSKPFLPECTSLGDLRRTISKSKGAGNIALYDNLVNCLGPQKVSLSGSPQFINCTLYNKDGIGLLELYSSIKKIPILSLLFYQICHS